MYKKFNSGKGLRVFKFDFVKNEKRTTFSFVSVVTPEEAKDLSNQILKAISQTQVEIERYDRIFDWILFFEHKYPCFHFVKKVSLCLEEDNSFLQGDNLRKNLNFFSDIIDKWADKADLYYLVNAGGIWNDDHGDELYSSYLTICKRIYSKDDTYQYYSILQKFQWDGDQFEHWGIFSIDKFIKYRVENNTSSTLKFFNTSPGTEALIIPVEVPGINNIFNLGEATGVLLNIENISDNNDALKFIYTGQKLKR